MTTTRESVRNAIDAELRRQAAADTKALPHLNIWLMRDRQVADINGAVDLDALADAIVEHVV